MWSDLNVLMNTTTKIAFGAYLVISLIFDIWSGHMSFLRDLVITVAIVLVIRVFLVLTKSKNSN